MVFKMELSSIERYETYEKRKREIKMAMYLIQDT